MGNDNTGNYELFRDASTERNEEIEKEDVIGESNEKLITEPFNPDDIDVEISTVNLGLIIDQIENDEIDLNPEFQRASDVWDNVKKSRLIESILLGLPLPSFYFSEDSVTKKLIIIDGLQRLCAIKDFVIEKDTPLCLNGLQFLRQFEGKKYSELQRNEIRRINSIKINVNTLRKSTPSDVKFIIFQRINTLGEPLTPQEMRNALNQGQASVFIKKLSKMGPFIKATDYKVKSKRMEDRDFVNRFVAFYIGYNEYKGELDSFLNDQMKRLNSFDASELKKIRCAFEKSMNCCFDIFEKDAFRRRYNVDDPRKPISKSIFDALSVNIAWLTDYERELLVEKKEVVKEKMIELCNNPQFRSSISTGTGQIYNVQKRFSLIKNMLKEVLQ